MITKEILYMLAHSGRADFTLTVQNIGHDGTMDCVIRPYPSVVGVDPIQFFLPSSKALSERILQQQMLADAVRDFKATLRALDLMEDSN